MRTWLFTTWEKVRSSYWFIPSVMTVLAVGLGLLTTAIDQRIDIEDPTNLDYIYSGGADGARQLFGTVAGSMITVAGVVFSMTVVTLALAAQQFGSRLLYNFMRDTGNQVVLGTFVSTYVFCILALRTVRGGDENGFVPHVSVTTAVVLSLASLGVLIYFIDHIAASINPSNIIAAVGEELDDSIDHLFPQKIGKGEPSEEEGRESPSVAASEDHGHPLSIHKVCAKRGGYVQYLDGDVLISVASGCDWVVRTYKRPGSLVLEGEALAEVHARDSAKDDDLERVRRAFVLGHERTSSQDLIFPINQIVQVAQRALSPGINDPHTALLCIDHLAMSFSRLVRRMSPSGLRTDSDGAVRLVTKPHSFADALEAAIDPIRPYALASVEVTSRLLGALDALVERAHTEEQRAALRRQAELFLQCIRSHQGYCDREREKLVDQAEALLAQLPEA